jgi:phosphatidyl-myo-inositol dimannoside synthase
MSGPDCLLLADDYLPHFGGSRVYYHEVAKRLAGRMAVVTRKRPDAAAFDKGLNYPLKRIMLPGQSLPGPAALGEAANAAALATMGATRFPSARCILAGEITPTAFAAYAAAAWRGMRYGVFVHDEPLMGAGSVESDLRRWVLSRAGAIVVSSSFPAARAAECAPGVSIFRAFAGVDTERFSPGEADGEVLGRYGVANEGYVLSVGRLVDYKNVGLAIGAVAAVKEGDVSLVIVGEGPARGALEAEARSSGISTRVVFAGRVAEKDLVQLYRGAIAYVFPSRRLGTMQHEGIGVAALEAAACGTVVLASTETSAGDFVEEGRTGFLFDPGSVGALTGLIERLVKNPSERSEIARRGTERVRAEFAWERAAATVAEAIDLLAKS